MNITAHNILSAMATYASYHETVGNYYDRQLLIEQISHADVQNLLLGIAMLNNPASIDNKLIRNDFINYFSAKHSDKPVREILSQHPVLFHPQGLLNVAKWLIAYGDFSKVEPVFSQTENIHIYVRMAIELCMIISDFIDQKMNGADRFELLQADLLRNANFNSVVDIASLVPRTLYLLDDLSTIAESHGYNYKEKFVTEYKYTIREYISLLFALYSVYLAKDKNITPYNIDTFFGSTRIPERGRAFFDLLLCTPADLQRWALDTIDNGWEFREFWRKPLLLMPCGRLHPIFPSILIQNLYVDLEIKICHLYPNNSGRAEIKGMLGLQFEKYVCDLASETFERAKYVTKIIPEFTYGGNKSPDFMILFGDNLLVIEIKSQRPLARFAFQDDLEPVQEGVNRIVVQPMNQALERMGELLAINNWDGESRPVIADVYIMIVTLGGITTWEANEDYIRSSLVIPPNVPFSGGFHVDIHEFELLCELATRKHAKPFLRYLSRNNPQKLPFDYFLKVESLYPRRPEKIKKLYEEKTELLRATLFG